MMPDPTSTPDAPDLSKATPRPWRVEEDIRIRKRRDGTLFEDVAGLDITSDDGEIVGSEGINGDGEKERANAALIVAAVNAYEPAALRAERDEAQPVALDHSPFQVLIDFITTDYDHGDGAHDDGCEICAALASAQKILDALPPAAVEPGAAGGLEPERCPHCGYTAEDKARWLDHDRCPGRRALEGDEK